VRIKHIIQKTICTTGSNTAKKYIRVLIVSAAFGTLVLLIPSSKEAEQKSRPFTLNSSISRVHFSGCLTQENYLLSDNDDFTLEGSPKFYGQSFIANPNLSTNLPISSIWEISSGVRESSPYISFFSYLPLRSPPLFS